MSHPHKPQKLYHRNISDSSSPPPFKPDWRSRIRLAQIVTQISTILTQRSRSHWASLLKPFKLGSSDFTPHLFLQIFHKTQNHPSVALGFFNYACKNLGFIPDLKTLCKLARVLFGSGLSAQSKPILGSLVQDYPASRIVRALVKGTDFDTRSSLLSSLLDCYCDGRLYLQALEVYQRSKDYGCLVSICGCNALLGGLLDKNEIRMFWCFYGLMVRDGVSGNLFTWSLIALALSKDGKFERIVKIFDMGIYCPTMYDLTIEGYCKRGDFKVALIYLDEMQNKGIDPSFSTFSCILDGACEFRDVKLISDVINSMVGKGYLPKKIHEDYDLVIQKLSDSGKTFAAELFYTRAKEEKIELQGTTYGSVLRSLSNARRVKDAINFFDSAVAKRNDVISDAYLLPFFKMLCEESPSEDVSRLFKGLIERGLTLAPCVGQISAYITSQCQNRWWKQAEELLNVVLNKGILPKASCFSFLVKNYCCSGQINSAISLHAKVEGLDGNFDVNTYIKLLDGLFREKKIEEAIRIFDYMRMHDVLSSESFSIVIRRLCAEKNFKKAMRLHDEMLEMGLKPDAKKYKHLISGFK
ncbi:unnamed protein product [Cuscuta campestris]|uniref:Pentacotripeptide-repeat region of PRORP domain-containing protein n=1 Tax=Cuscuta campestris TaxID=132261 RepID=A0A484K3A3_9ASTE|nr:unnamed protein product [Cuscuta campestris]